MVAPQKGLFYGFRGLNLLKIVPAGGDGAYYGGIGALVSVCGAVGQRLARVLERGC